MFIGAGRSDEIAPPAETERLADLLRESGAEVTVHREAIEHTIGEAELEAARVWLTRFA